MAKHLTPLEVWKLERIKKKLGVLTSEEAFALALHADQFLKDTPMHDPAWEYLTTQRMEMLDYAELLEKEELALKEQVAA